MNNTNLKTPLFTSNHAATPRLHITALDGMVTEESILVVEDNDILRGVHEAVLNRAGYDTLGAANGQEALASLAAREFDLVLTDRRMPVLDGVGLIRALRAAGNRIPVMMVSLSLADGGELPADVRSEVVVALPKPVKTEDLLAGVAHALRPQSAVPHRTGIATEFPTIAAAPRRTRIAEVFGTATYFFQQHSPRPRS